MFSNMFHMGKCLISIMMSSNELEGKYGFLFRVDVEAQFCSLNIKASMHRCIFSSQFYVNINVELNVNIIKTRFLENYDRYETQTSGGLIRLWAIDFNQDRQHPTIPW